jgi:endoplasmic reticulum-Golgi intermediate compartment protein 2
MLFVRTPALLTYISYIQSFNLELAFSLLPLDCVESHGLTKFSITAKAKPQYVTQTSGGGKWTVAMLCVSFLLIFSEFTRWWRGNETHTFAVEKGVGHNLQINLDIVIPMQCADIHVNVQDAAGDRILAGDMLKRDPTNWRQWVDARGVHRLGKDAQGRVITGEGFHDHEEGFGEEHVHDIIAQAGGGRAKFAKTPKLRWGSPGGDSCRLFGSLDVNKVQGDFHITARGHGYQEMFAEHLDHNGTFPPSLKVLAWGNWLTSINSIQLLPHHLRALFRRLLPVTPQPPRQNHLHRSKPLPQIPILPLRRAYRIFRRLEQHLLLSHGVHQPVRSNGTIDGGW